MKKTILLVALCGGFTTIDSARAQGTAFTYQGRLNIGTNGVTALFDLQLYLYNAATGGSIIAGPVTNTAVPVTNGLFQVLVDFGAGAFTGSSDWLSVGVRTNGSGTAFSTLAPRNQVTATPYAIFAETANAAGLAGTIPAGDLSGAYSGAVTMNNAGNSFAGNGTGLTNVNAASLNGLSAAGFWQLAGNNVATGNFLGSTNNQPVELWVNGARALRLEPTANNANHSNLVNAVGGSSANYVQPGTYGAVIAGGGAASYLGNNNYSNSAASDLSFIGGGAQNAIQASAAHSVIGGGQSNSILPSSDHAFIGGGQNNSVFSSSDHSFIGGGIGDLIQASAAHSFIGGGENNLIQTNSNHGSIAGGFDNTIQTASARSVIGGGESNLIQTNANHSVIGGGENNAVTGPFGTVPGGNNNTAAANSFAAGASAMASNTNSFVWSDGTVFGTTANNQFLIHASGGVGINTNSPGALLDVDGTINAAGTLTVGAPNTSARILLQTSPGYGFSHSDGTCSLATYVNGPGGFGGQIGTVTDHPFGLFVNNGNPILTLATNGNVGINKNNPAAALDVAGTINAAGTLTVGTTNTTSQLILRTSPGGYGFFHFDGTCEVATYVNGPGGFGGQIGTVTDHPFGLFVNNGNPILTLATNGSVGINKNNPAAALDVAGTVNATFFTGNGSGLTGLNFTQLPAGVVTNTETGVTLNAPTLNGTLNLPNASINSGGTSLLYADFGGDCFAGLGAGAADFGDDADTAFGYEALAANEGGTENVALGMSALQSNISGNGNTAVGYSALDAITQGSNNIALGYLAGYTLNSGSRNIYIGNPGQSSENGIIRIGTGQTATYLVGTVNIPVLNITGGSDLAEPFTISSADGEVPQGAVVVIDDQNPGRLKLSDTAYDVRVAGVVSGANGITPGIQMHQQGLLEGGKNVALTGRVYVQADNVNGAIRPGDMLTTSSTPGRAMKVTDHAKATGAILGKAMTGLSEGQGMVLVLVTLQ